MSGLRRYEDLGAGIGEGGGGDLTRDIALPIGPHRSGGRRRKARAPSPQLVRTIEGEIIPRLVMAYRHHIDDRTEPAPQVEVTPEQVLAFCEIIVNEDATVAEAYIEGLRVSGVTLDAILVDLLASAARELGTRWEEDRTGFAEVTVGLCRIQTILRDLGHLLDFERDPFLRFGRILLAAVPGEQHTLGIRMVEEFLRRAGCDVEGVPLPTCEGLQARLGEEWFDIVGLSASCEASLDLLKTILPRLRQASLNKAIKIMVGGKAFDGFPERVALVGADAGAIDGREAVVQAHALLRQAANIGARRS